ncbi:MAG: Rieske (2Fe-2S) protein [Myxococcota bacterium]|nr:Rieske (2Fe-2S) protein [Myxococcota bacterium]
MKARVVLSRPQRSSVTRGRFVSIEVEARSVLVGRVGGAWHAYENVCRHRALPLDLGASSPMSDDGRFLLCHQHGALYRPADGACIAGPCEGQSLTPVDIVEENDGLWIGSADRRTGD